MHIVAFKKHEYAAGYDDYRRLQYEVFVQELGWSAIPSDHESGLILESETDDHCIFVNCIDDHGICAGTLRGFPNAAILMPHSELFTRHLNRAFLAGHLDRVGSINGVAVAKAFRGSGYLSRDKANSESSRSSIGSDMLCCLVDAMAKQGCRIVFLSTGAIPMALLFSRLGGKIVDGPFSFSGPLPALINMGAVIGHLVHGSRPGHFTSIEMGEWQERAHAYFCDCEGETLREQILSRYVLANLIGLDRVEKQEPMLQESSLRQGSLLAEAS